MHFITRSTCRGCAAPLPDAGEVARDALCDDCLISPPAWDGARAATIYDGSAKRMVLALKHGDRPDLGPLMGRWLAQALHGTDPGSVVIPIPLHPRRLLRRKYNQAELMSHMVARSLGLAHEPLALRRARNTLPQGHRSAEDRRQNMDRAFTVPRVAAQRLAGRPVLLIDDVMASGATMSEATRTLRMAGLGPVTVAVLARAVKDN